MQSPLLSKAPAEPHKKHSRGHYSFFSIDEIANVFLLSEIFVFSGVELKNVGKSKYAEPFESLGFFGTYPLKLIESVVQTYATDRSLRCSRHDS